MDSLQPTVSRDFSDIPVKHPTTETVWLVQRHVGEGYWTTYAFALDRAEVLMAELVELNMGDSFRLISVEVTTE